MDEIERKWVFKPGKCFSALLHGASQVEIEQYYLKITEDEEDRYRRKGTKYLHEKKIGSGLKRKEIPIVDIDANLFEERKGVRVGSIIKKTRYTVLMGEHKLEIDFYTEPVINEVRVIEVEFNTEEEASDFEFDPVVSKTLLNLKEVTDDKNYKNKNIALYGFPTLTKN